MTFYICRCFPELVCDETIYVSKGSLFKVEHRQTVTKLRPFVRTFLKEASEIFDLCIYTLGDRTYSLEMAKLLDPEREYFNANSNVISRDDGTQNRKKHLGMVLEKESAILILDDTKHVSALLVSDLFWLNYLISVDYNCGESIKLKLSHFSVMYEIFANKFVRYGRSTKII